MRAAERNVLAAVRAGHDEKLGAAVRAVIDGELSAPLFSNGDTAKTFRAKFDALSIEAKHKLAAVQPNESVVEAKCDALGRHING